MLWCEPESSWVTVVIGTLPRPRPGGLCRSLCGHPAVCDEDASGDERRLVRRQEERNVRDLARFAGPADRLERVDRRIDGLEATEHLRVGVVDRGVDPARRDRVASDALLRIVERDPLAEHDDG